MLKAYEKHISGIAVIDDLEEKQIVERFDEIFTELYKIIPRTNRRLLFDMLHALSDLFAIVATTNWKAGYNFSNREKNLS
jgi:hypothetical protein